MADSPAERQRRRQARLRGEDVPKKVGGRPKGYKQTPEHVAKRQRYGPEHHSWKGANVRPESGRMRAERLYPRVGPCSECGKEKAERHHIDGDTTNNAPENIAILCRRCHMKADGRLEKAREHLRRVQPLGLAASHKAKRERAAAVNDRGDA